VLERMELEAAVEESPSLKGKTAGAGDLFCSGSIPGTQHGVRHRLVGVLLF
jgi:hypothetical protein